MNHGYCENCWWWEPIKFDLKEAKWVLGVCWAWKNTTTNKAYCPDYTNRKKYNKENGSLESWVKSLPKSFIYPKDSKLVKYE